MGKKYSYVIFQSTGSVWSPTMATQIKGIDISISIHGLRVEPDMPVKLGDDYSGISIHGLRVEPDREREALRKAKENFNPRAPCGARHYLAQYPLSKRTFQSTGSVWSPTRMGNDNIKM